MTSAREVFAAPDEETLAAAIAARLITSVADAQLARGGASVVLTGGGIGTAALRALAASPARGAVDWSAVDLWWGDERFVAAGDPERNDRQALQVLDGPLALSAARVHPIGSADRYPDPETAAAAYEAELRRAGGGQVPVFDVVLLGLGPEGHTASIFPASPAVSDMRSVLAVRDCPKPPPVRVSLGFTAIQRGRQVWLLASGASKADAVAELLGGAGPAELPGAGAVGSDRSLLLADWAALRR